MDVREPGIHPSPLSHVIPVMGVSYKGREVNISATKQELTDTADALGLVLVRSLSARLHISKVSESLLAVYGHMSADVVQTCSVSLEPVTENISTEFNHHFTSHTETVFSEIAFKIEDEDPPERIVDGHIDIGGILLEHLILNLNPYPRAPNAQFNQKNVKSGESGANSNVPGPFSDLAKLQRPEK